MLNFLDDDTDDDYNNKNNNKNNKTNNNNKNSNNNPLLLLSKNTSIPLICCQNEESATKIIHDMDHYIFPGLQIKALGLQCTNEWDGDGYMSFFFLTQLYTEWLEYPVNNHDLKRRI